LATGGMKSALTILGLGLRDAITPYQEDLAI
jgi:hypothetical protein